MGRVQRALTSLVAAIPAGFLAYRLVMVFLNQADSLTTVIQVVAGLTLACAALVVLMPFGLLILGGKKAASAEPARGAAAGKKGKDQDEGLMADDDGDLMADEDVVETASDELDAEEDLFGDSVSDKAASDDAVESMGSSDAMDVMADSDAELTSGASSLDEIEEFDFGDEEDEEPPAKKRKK